MPRFNDYLPLNLAFAFTGAPAYPDAAVQLQDIEKSLNIYLHALMRSCEQTLVTASRKRALSRSLSARRHMNILVWQESGNTHLPEFIQRFDDAPLNRDLYYWLAAYIAFDEPLPAPEHNQHALSPALGHLLQGIMTSARVLKACPGLSERYRRLAAACLAERSRLVPVARLRRHEAAAIIECGVRRALGDLTASVPRWLEHAMDAAQAGIVLPDPPAALLKAKLPFWPAALWGRPVQAEARPISLADELIDGELIETKRMPTTIWTYRTKKRKRTRVN
jgi:nitric oxide reductase NorD protein